MSTRDATDLRRASLRLALQFGGLILVLFALLGVVTFEVVRSAQAEARNNALIDADVADSPAHAPRDVLMATVVAGHLEVSPRSPEWFPIQSLLTTATNSRDAVVTSRTEGKATWVIRTDSDHNRITQVAINTSEDAGELNRLAIALLVSGIIASVAAAGISILMTRRAMRPMVEALALQRRFVTDASHELRTPLTLLSTRAQLLRRELRAAPTTDPVAKGLDDILQDSRELTAILEDLLLSADPRESTPREPIDLNVLAEEAVSLATPEFLERGKTLVAALESHPVMVVGSRPAIARLITSLISNALDHANAVVTIAISSHSRIARIGVRDDGPGFPDSMSARAFDRFATSRPGAPAGDGAADAGEGTAPRHYGLGLALVAEVAARHGGRVEIVATEPGEGAEIAVELPLSNT